MNAKNAAALRDDYDEILPQTVFGEWEAMIRVQVLKTQKPSSFHKSTSRFHVRSHGQCLLAHVQK